MNDFVFRKAEISDIDELVKLRINQLREEGAKENEDISLALKDFLKRNILNGNFISWIGIKDNRIIATSGVAFSEKPPYYGNISGYIGNISCMYTIKEYRRKGIAKKLLGLVVEEAKKHGCGSVQITASNMGVFLYTDYGFEKNKNFMQYSIK